MAVNPIVSSVDPITFEILSHRVYQIAKEMGSTLGARRRHGEHDADARLHGFPIFTQRRCFIRRRCHGLACRVCRFCRQANHRAL